MSSVFTNSSTLFHVNDNTVPLLLFIRVAGTGAGSSLTDNPFNNVDITNFSTKSNADFSVQRSASGGFVYNVFGNSAVIVTLDGVQSDVNHPTGKGDIEAYYTKHNIAAADKDRVLVKITAIHHTTSTLDGKERLNQNAPDTTEYVGYLVGFTKKPMGQDKIAGYGFQLSLVCTIAPKQTTT